MLIAQATTDILRVVTGEAADIEVHASWMDKNGSTFTPGRTDLASITTATTTNILDMTGASAGTYRNVKALSLRNNHASQQCNVTVEHTDGTNVETLMKCLLLAGETLILDGDGKWTHYLASGAPYAASGPMATQAEMEAGTSIGVIVTPGRQHFHPGHPKTWAKFGVTGNLLGSYNVTSVSDDGTGLATVTIATDFSDANWVCQVTTERASTALTVANARDQAIRSGGQAAGTVTVECWNHDASTPALADPSAWHVFGLGDQA
jgi:hypothetical protein